MGHYAWKVCFNLPHLYRSKIRPWQLALSNSSHGWYITANITDSFKVKVIDNVSNNILPIFVCGSEVSVTSTLAKNIDALDRLTIGASDLFSISTGRILSPMTWFGHAENRESHPFLFHRNTATSSCTAVFLTRRNVNDLYWHSHC